MAGPLVGLRDGATHQVHGGNARAITGADGQVAGHGEGFGRQGAQSHQVAPAGEESPLSGVDALGVVGEDGLQGRGHAPVGGAQSRGEYPAIGQSARSVAICNDSGDHPCRSVRAVSSWMSPTGRASTSLLSMAYDSQARACRVRRIGLAPRAPARSGRCCGA